MAVRRQRSSRLIATQLFLSATFFFCYTETLSSVSICGVMRERHSGVMPLPSDVIVKNDRSGSVSICGVMRERHSGVMPLPRDVIIKGPSQPVKEFFRHRSLFSCPL